MSFISIDRTSLNESQSCFYSEASLKPPWFCLFCPMLLKLPHLSSDTLLKKSLEALKVYGSLDTRLCGHLKSNVNIPHSVWTNRYNRSRNSIFVGKCWWVNAISYPMVIQILLWIKRCRFLQTCCASTQGCLLRSTQMTQTCSQRTHH